MLSIDTTVAPAPLIHSRLKDTEKWGGSGAGFFLSFYDEGFFLMLLRGKKRNEPFGVCVGTIIGF